jgi:hypothetical protein
MRERDVGWECRLMGIKRVCYSKSREFFFLPTLLLCTCSAHAHAHTHTYITTACIDRAAERQSTQAQRIVTSEHL